MRELRRRASWTNRQDTRSHIAHLLESLLASHGRIVFTARTRPAFRSPQSLRRPPDDVTALTLLVVMMTSLVGARQLLPQPCLAKKGAGRLMPFFALLPPFSLAAASIITSGDHLHTPSFEFSAMDLRWYRAVAHTTPLLERMHERSSSLLRHKCGQNAEGQQGTGAGKSGRSRSL